MSIRREFTFINHLFYSPHVIVLLGKIKTFTFGCLLDASGRFVYVVWLMLDSDFFVKGYG